MKNIKNLLLSFLFISAFSGCEKENAINLNDVRNNVLGKYDVEATLSPLDHPEDATKYTFKSTFRPLQSPPHDPGSFEFQGALLSNPFQGFSSTFTSPTTFKIERQNPGTDGWFLEVAGTGTLFADKTINMDISVFDNRQGEKKNEFQNVGVKIGDIRAKFTPINE